MACGLPHHLKWLGFKAITAGAKVRWLQQLVDAVSQAAFEGQVPLHDAGLVFTYHELALMREDIGAMGVSAPDLPARLP